MAGEWSFGIIWSIKQKEREKNVESSVIYKHFPRNKSYLAQATVVTAIDVHHRDSPYYVGVIEYGHPGPGRASNLQRTNLPVCPRLRRRLRQHALGTLAPDESPIPISDTLIDYIIILWENLHELWT